MLRRSTDVVGQYYLSSLSPSWTVEHLSCSESKCIADNIDEARYQTVHAIAGCDCNSFGPSSDELRSIISSGGIPVVKFAQRPDTKEYKLFMSKAEDGTPYVAISHVWSHGLGNPHKNSLPACQLWRIQGSVVSLFAAESDTANGNWVAFWMDTLCVPVSPDLRHLRKSAIGRMHETYKKAQQVLVLDRELQRASLDSPWTEQCARITMSHWNRRLWTLVEGTLATKLNFRFEDGALRVGRIPDLQGETRVPREVANSMSKIRMQLEYVGYSSSGPDQLRWIVNELEHRATTKAEDESVCIATMMGCAPSSISLILNQPNPIRRMQILYQQLQKLPIWILFVPGPRMTLEGYRWAPRSFLFGASRILNQEGVATTSMSGVLHVRLPGFIILSQVIPLHEYLFDPKIPFLALQVLDTSKRRKNTMLFERVSEPKHYGLVYLPDGTERPVMNGRDKLAIVIDKLEWTTGKMRVGALVALTEKSMSPGITPGTGLQVFKDDINSSAYEGLAAESISRLTCRFICRVGLSEILGSGSNWRTESKEWLRVGAGRFGRAAVQSDRILGPLWWTGIRARPKK
jgi:hypothetical protein